MNSNLGTWTVVRTGFGDFHVAQLGGAIVQTALPGTKQAAFLDLITARYHGVSFHRDDHDPLLRKGAAQLVEYAEGRRTKFDVPLRPEGTEFQGMVWNALAQIPFGEVRSYQDIAAAIGRPGASRAVGQANHHNPVAPFIPCHRVVTSSGTLGGYGGGMPLKKALLDHEGVAPHDHVRRD